MRDARSALVPLVLVILSAPFAGADEPKPDDKYTIILLVNESPYRVNYRYTWGGNPDEASWSASIPPNGKRGHTWTFARAGRNNTPWFYVQLDGQSGWHKLEGFWSAENTQERGRIYFVRYDDATMKLKLFSKLYTE
jgi:hypothetical protein